MVRHAGKDFTNEERFSVAPMLAFQSAGLNSSMRDTPQLDCFAAAADASLGQKVFNVAVAKMKAKVDQTT